MTLSDEHASMMDRLGEAKLVDLGLQTAFQEILCAQREDVIELHARLVEHADAHETADERVAFEEALRVLFVEGEQFTCGTADFGEGELDAPHLAFVAQTVFTDDFELGITVVLFGRAAASKWLMRVHSWRKQRQATDHWPERGLLILTDAQIQMLDDRVSDI